MPDLIHDMRRSAVAALLAFGGISGFAAAASAAGESRDDMTCAEIRLAQRSGGACAESCMGQCRSAQSACLASGQDAGSCRTQFQICVRRCVVQCGGR